MANENLPKGKINGWIERRFGRLYYVIRGPNIYKIMPLIQWRYAQRMNEI